MGSKFSYMGFYGVLITLICCSKSLIDAFKYNISLMEMSTCQEFDVANTGYEYRKFFHINTLKNNKIDSKERLHLKFYVLSSMDAHILLAPTSSPGPADRVYEIVIGAGGNTFSVIRLNMGRRRVSTNQFRHILSPLDPTPIEIVQMKDGDLLVYVPGFREEPFLNYTDISPLDINYLSFSSYGSILAKWFYDCKFDGFENEMEEEIPRLTPLQQLLSNITEKAEEASMPRALDSVKFAFAVMSLSYKSNLSVLRTRLNLVLTWQDSNLQWDPKEFNNIKTVVEPTLDIWTPNLIVLNGAYDTLGSLDLSYDLRLNYAGLVTLRASNVEITTWCTNTALNWPNEKLNCKMIFGLGDYTFSNDTAVKLEHDLSKPLPINAIDTFTEWKLMQIKISNIGNSLTKGRYNDEGIMQTIAGDVAVEVGIMRNGNYYNTVFHIPVYACQALIFLSFLLRGYRRGGLILIVFVISCMGLMFITKHAPSSYVPKTIQVYKFCMGFATFCYIIHIIIMWFDLYPPKAKPAGCMMAIVNSTPLRFVLCMRYADATEYVYIQEHPWHEIAKMINSLTLFIAFVYFILVDVML